MCLQSALMEATGDEDGGEHPSSKLQHGALAGVGHQGNVPDHEKTCDGTSSAQERGDAPPHAPLLQPAPTAADGAWAASSQPASTAADNSSGVSEQPDDLAQLLVRMHARSEAESSAAQARLLASTSESQPAAQIHTAHSRDSTRLPAAQEAVSHGSNSSMRQTSLADAAAGNAAVTSTTACTDNGDAQPAAPSSGQGPVGSQSTPGAACGMQDMKQEGRVSESATAGPAHDVGTPGGSAETLEQLAGLAADEDSDGDDGWSPAATADCATALPNVTPRAADAAQASMSSNDGSRRGNCSSEMSQASPPPSGGWTPRAVAETGSGSPRYPVVDYAGAEAARRARQRLQSLNHARGGAARRQDPARQLFRAPQGVAAVRRQSRPSSGGGRSLRSAGGGRSSNASTSGGGGSGDGQLQPRSAAKGKGRKWSGAAPPGVQLYGRVHAWKEDNKQR